MLGGLLAALQLSSAEPEVGVRWRLGYPTTGQFLHADPISGHVNLSSSLFTLFRVGRLPSGEPRLFDDASGLAVAASLDRHWIVLQRKFRPRNDLHKLPGGKAGRKAGGKAGSKAGGAGLYRSKRTHHMKQEWNDPEFKWRPGVMIEARDGGRWALKHMVPPATDGTGGGRAGCHPGCYVNAPLGNALPLGAAASTAALFILERIANAEPGAPSSAHSSATPAPATPPATPAPATPAPATPPIVRRLHKLTFPIQGRPTVLVASFNLRHVGWTPLWWRWLSASGALGFALVHTDAYACESTRALLCATSNGGGGGEGGG